MNYISLKPLLPILISSFTLESQTAHFHLPKPEVCCRTLVVCVGNFIFHLFLNLHFKLNLIN